MIEKANTYNNTNSQQFNNIFLLNEMKQENQKLRQQIEKLKKSNLTLSVEKEDLKRIINQLRSKENECLILQDIILQKEKEIENINNILLKERKDFQEDKRKTEVNYENELMHIKRDQDKDKRKIENFNKMNNLNDILYSKVLELEKQLQNDYNYLYNAYKYEMYNHEYVINSYQRNFDTLSAFYGNIEYNEDDDMHKYFERLNFNEIQVKAYKDAARYVWNNFKE